MRRSWTYLVVPLMGTAIVAVFLGRNATDVVAQPNNPPEAANDVEILGYGPIHEAFAQPAAATIESSIIVQKKPPEPIEELPSEYRPEGDNVVWIPGYWAFDTERDDFIWVSGLWRNIPPDRIWVSGYWVAEGQGYRWVAGYWSAVTQTQVYYPPPPEPIVEAVAPAPDDRSFYVAGNWVYQDTRYLWRPGYWTPYQAGWCWTQPRYQWTPGGYVFVDGYWDYDFNRRGMLFAPAYFGPQAFGPNRFYQPSFALSTNLLFASLFIRPNAGAYYFGDYYAPRYAGLGFIPWIDYRYRGRFADPLWTNQAWQNRGTPRWEQQLRQTYAARQRGEAPRPARRFDPQTAAQAQPNGNVNQNVNLVMPAQQVQTAADVKVRRVSKEELNVSRQNAEQARAFARTRQNAERKINLKESRKGPVRADLPLPKVAGGAGKRDPQPETPQVPKLEPKQSPPKGPKGKDAPPTPKTDPTPKGKQPAPTPDQPKLDPKKTPTPKQPDPPITSQPKGKDPAPPQPKTAPPDQPKPPQPKLDPQPKGKPKTLPAPIPKTGQPDQPVPQPKTIPQPKINPKTSPAPIPKVAPAPQPAPPQPQPQPQPKIAPQPKPTPKASPAPIPKAVPQPAPVPKVQAPQPRPVPKAAPAPKAAPKVAPPPPQAAPQPPPQIQRPAAPPARPEAPKGKGKKKDEVGV